MILEATTQHYVKVDCGFDYPFFRMTFNQKDEPTYWAFYDHEKITIIHEGMVKTEITTYCDERISRDILTPDMLHGHNGFSIIGENIFNNALDRLISKISRS